MPLDFPSSPTINQTYSFSGKTWVWNGIGWRLQSGALTADSVTTSMIVDGAVTNTKIAATGLYSITTTATSKTLANRERCTVTAATQTITLPASPAAGWEVSVAIDGTFTDTVVARNGSNIMSLAEDITINQANAAVTLYYVDATRGWRII